MLDEGLIGALVIAEAIGYRRAVFGRPPRKPVRVLPCGVAATSIHLFFHTLATAAPSALSAMALVFAGWTTFILWWKWVARAPKPKWGDGDDSGGDSGGGRGGGGGSGPGGNDRDPNGGGPEFDWDALERDMEDYLQRDRQLVGAT